MTQPLFDIQSGYQKAFATKFLYKKDLDPIMVTLYRAHEFAHYWLGGGESACNEMNLDLEASEEHIPLGAERVEVYSQIDHRELQANVCVAYITPGRLRVGCLGSVETDFRCSG